MAIVSSGIDFEIREVVLRNKPEQMLQASAKGTVPVLVLDKQIIDESLDILHWALNINDPAGLRNYSILQRAQMDKLIQQCDENFKTHLDHYKYSDRHPQHSPETYRSWGEEFLRLLDSQLNQVAQQTDCQQPYLFGAQLCYADIAIVPFIRQFANVDFDWFTNTEYHKLKDWLAYILESEIFTSVMKKYKPWQQEDPPLYFEK